MKIKNIIRFLDCYPITVSLFFAVGFNFLLFGGAFAMLASVLFLQGLLSYLFFTMGFISSIASFYLLNAMNKIGSSLGKKNNNNAISNFYDWWSKNDL